MSELHAPRLVLSRLPGQQIDIAGGIDRGGTTITVEKIVGMRKVRLSIQSPPSVTIYRREIQARINAATD